MSFVVRHKTTGYYLQSHHAWTNRLDSALQFNSGLRLVHYLERAGVHENPEQLEILSFHPLVNSIPLSRARRENISNAGGHMQPTHTPKPPIYRTAFPRG